MDSLRSRSPRDRELTVSKPAWTAAVSLLLDEYFVQRQAGDLQALSTALQATAGATGKPFACYGAPNTSLILVHALPGLTQDNRMDVQWYILRDGFLSYRQFWSVPYRWSVRMPCLQTANRRLPPRRKSRFTFFRTARWSVSTC